MDTNIGRSFLYKLYSGEARGYGCRPIQNRSVFACYKCAIVQSPRAPGRDDTLSTSTTNVGKVPPTHHRALCTALVRCEGSDDEASDDTCHTVCSGR